MGRMTVTKMRWSALLLLCAVACAKSEGQRQQELRSCGTIGSKAEAIARCLVQRYGWKESEARAAAPIRQHELDSTMVWLEDSAWTADSLDHRRAINWCRAGETAECLQFKFGWEERRAVRAADSVWQLQAGAHRRQVQSCARRGIANVAACLMIGHQWPRSRAEAVRDSLFRAHRR